MKLSHSTKQKVSSEIFEHMKRSGAFDEIRMGLIDPIWSHSRFQHIIDNFELECERFCKDSDLDQTRSYLRNRLNERFKHSSTSKDLVKDHVYRFLGESDSGLRSKYCEHAREFLKRFLPDTSGPEDEVQAAISQKTPPEPQVEDMDIELTPVDNEGSSSMDIGSSNGAEEELNNEGIDDFNDFIDEEEIERPRYSPIGNSIVQQTDEHPLHTDDNTALDNKLEPTTQNEDTQVKPEILLKSEDSAEQLPNETIPNPPLPVDDDDDELERLTFSSVSTVSTAELSGYDNLIELSDDEANIVGKPKNSSVPIEVVQGQINDLQTTSEECKPSEMLEASESDGGWSETNTTGKRVARMRKSNPRYNNGDYKLL